MHPCEMLLPITANIPLTISTDSNPGSQSKSSPAPNPQPLLNDLFVEQDRDPQPYVMAPWASAISRIKRARLVTEKGLPIHLYTFPGPKLFTAINPDRLKTFLTSWLHIRPHWIGQVRSRAPHCDLALKSQTWRDMLRFGMGGPQPERMGPDSLHKVQEEMAACKLMVSDDLRTITFDNGQRLYVEPSRISGLPPVQVVTWKNTDYNFLRYGVPATVLREVLWELHELNFRFDLIKLDACLRKEDGDVRSALKRQDMLLKCWGARDHDFYDPTHIEWLGYDGALGAQDISRRLRYIRYLYDLCGTWAQFPMPKGMDNIDNDLEVDAARYYEKELYSAIQQTFFDLFGRPMVPPRSLHK